MIGQIQRALWNTNGLLADVLGMASNSGAKSPESGGESRRERYIHIYINERKKGKRYERIVKEGRGKKRKIHERGRKDGEGREKR